MKDKKASLFGKEIPSSDEWPDISSHQIKATSSPGVSIPNADDIDFSNKDFSVSGSVSNSSPVWFYDENFLCRQCGHQGTYSARHDKPGGSVTAKYACPVCYNKLMKLCPTMEVEGLQLQNIKSQFTFFNRALAKSEVDDLYNEWLQSGEIKLPTKKKSSWFKPLFDWIHNLKDRLLIRFIMGKKGY